MTRLDFNLTIAREVMGWETPTSHEHAENGYQYVLDRLWQDGPDFTSDHNAAALVRERMAKFRRIPEFIDALTAIVGSDWQMVGAGYTDMWDLLSATPEQTARAAYRAVTGKELEVVDE